MSAAIAQPRVTAGSGDEISEASHGLTGLPGVGKGTAQRIAQYIESGHMDVLDELEKKLPRGLPALLEISGMGPKKIAFVYRELSVEGMDG